MSGPYCCQIFMDRVLDILKPARNKSPSLMSRFSKTCCAICLAFFREIPLISASRSGSWSSIVNVSSPKACTILCASAFLIPLTCPDARYRSMAAAFSGGRISKESILNCSPYVEWVVQKPLRFSSSPSPTSGREPTAVNTQSSPAFSRSGSDRLRTVYPFSSLRYVMCST